MSEELHDGTKSFLDQQDPEAIKEVMKNPKKFISIYNHMCRKCKQKALQDSTRPFQDYCLVCQKKAERIMYNDN